MAQMGLTAEQLAERRKWLGGTDAAALAGVNPPGWAQPIDVYLEKVGLAPERRPSTAMSTGSLLEPVVAQLFTEATGIRLRRTSRPVRSRRYPWMGGHLDRWADDGMVFEAKWSMNRLEWGPGLPIGTTDAPTVIPAPGDPAYAPRVPLRYAVQVQHYLAVTGRPSAYLGVLLGWGDFRWYVLHRDDALIGTLLELEERFWHDNVLAGVPPEPDGSDSYSRRLRSLYATDDGSGAVATPEQQLMLEEYRVARRVATEAAADLERMAQRLQTSMGHHQRILAPRATITWRQTEPRLTVRWEDLVTALLSHGYAGQADEDVLAALVDMPATWPTTKKDQAEVVRAFARAAGKASTTPGARPFLVAFEDSDEVA